MTATATERQARQARAIEQVRQALANFERRLAEAAPGGGGGTNLAPQEPARRAGSDD